MNCRQIKQDTFTANGRRLLVSTVEMWPGKFETLVMYACSYIDIDGKNARTEADALKNHADLVNKYKPAEKKAPVEKPLTGKYLKLAEDLKRIHAEAVKACANLNDGGACNHDAPALYLPRWNAEQIRQAAKLAGVGCFSWDSFGPKKWVFCPRVNGQAYRREKCAEFMTEALSRAGYDAITYCALD